MFWVFLFFVGCVFVSCYGCVSVFFVFVVFVFCFCCWLVAFLFVEVDMVFGVCWWCGGCDFVFVVVCFLSFFFFFVGLDFVGWLCLALYVGWLGCFFWGCVVL